MITPYQSSTYISLEESVIQGFLQKNNSYPESSLCPIAYFPEATVLTISAGSFIIYFRISK